MTIRLQEGFDYAPAGSNDTVINILERGGFYVYSNPVIGNPTGISFSTTTAFSEGKSFSLSQQYAQFDTRLRVLYPLGSNEQDGYWGSRIYVQSNHDGYGHVIFYDSSAAAYQITVCWRPNGVLQVWRGSPFTGTLLASSAAGTFYYQTWFFLEIYCKIDDTAGEVEVRVNTETVIDLVSADTQASANAYFDMVGWGGQDDSGSIPIITESWLMDDIYFCDSAGTVNNGFLGNVRSKIQFMVADGDNIDFSIGGSSPAATNWQSVLNTSINDTQYVYSPTIGDYDLYDVDPNLNSPLVHAVQVRAAMRQDDATQRVGKVVIKVSGTEYPGAEDFYLNQTYTYYKETYELNPYTLAGWTGTEVNAIQAGVKVEA